MRYEKFNWSDDFQDAVISCLIKKPDEFTQIFPVIQPEFFNGTEAVEVVFALKEFFEKYGHVPNFITLGNYVFQRTEKLNPEQADTLEQYVIKLEDVDTTDWQYVRDYSLKFCRERAIYYAIKKIGLAQAENKPVDPMGVMAKAMRVGTLDDIEDCATSEQQEPPPEIVEGILHQGSKLVFGGGSKTFKTFTLLDLALSVATGTPWWGRQTTQGPVLYINFEIQKPFFQQRCREIAEAKGVALQQGELEHWCLRGRAEAIENLMPQVLAYARPKRFVLIILDPIYKLMGGNRDENKAGDIATLMNELERLAVETGAAVAFGAHFSKGNQAGKESIDRIGGSGVFARDPDSILTLTRQETENVFVVEATLRNQPPLPKFCVEWKYPLFEPDVVGEFDPDRLKQQKGAPAKYTEHEFLTPLLKADNGELELTQYRQQVIDATGMDRKTFRTRFKILVSAGKLTETNGLVTDGRK